MDHVPNSGRGRALLLKMGQDAKKVTLGQEVPPSSYMVAPCFPMAGRGRAQLIGLAKAANENRPGSGLSSGISSMSSSSPLTISSQSPTGSTPSPMGSTPSPTGSTPSPPGSSTSPTSSGIVPSMVGGGRGMALGLIKAGGLGGPGLASKGRGMLLNMSRAESVASTISDTKTVTNEPSTSVESITTSLKSATIYSQGKDTLATTAQSSETDTTVKYHGTSGLSVSATANYISMGITPGSAAYEYDVKYEPAQDAKPFRIKMLKHHVPMLGPNTFDGCHLFLPRKLDSKVTELVSPHPVTGTPVNLQLIFKKARQFKDMIQLYNVLFKRIMSALKLVEFKRQYFDPKSAIMIPQYKLEIWPGYVTAVDEYEGGLMLMIDPSHRVLRKQSVLELVRDVIACNRRGGGWENELKAQLIGQTVMTTYNNKCYIIDDIDFSQTPLSKFEGKDGQVSFMEYYKTNYGIEITDMNQPLLINRKTKRDNVNDQPQDFLIALIPELCNLTGISEAMRNDFNLMKEMAKYTRITPNQRFYAIKKYVENVNANPLCKQMLKDWGLSIRAETVDLNARTLQPEQIMFGDKKVNGSLMADWSRDATTSKAILPIDINNWALLHVRKDEPCSKAFVETLMRCGPPMGIKVSQPQFVCLQSDKPEAYSMALKSVISGSVQIVVCISPTARDDRYTAIKKTCCVENPIPSQVINSRTLMNRDKLRAVVQKVALQMNCKLGGTLWALNMPFKNTMVVGIDVYHGAGKDSCVGFVASYNASLTKWHSSAIIVDRGQEVLDGLKSSFIQSLNFYYNANGQYPARIIIYRDGVGDGQLPVCMNFEVPQLETCFSLIDPNYNPPLTFVVVQKRINTRIFADLKNQQLENPNPGTVVDNTVTRKGMYDFFLVSQKVRQGTVTPTHYIVVHDSSGISPDHVQRFTYKMCHLYYNWPGTVRVPAPCQYAHKLAFLMGQVVRRPHHNSLSDKLFFL